MEEVRHKDYMLYVSIYRNFLEKVKLESRSVVAWGLGWEWGLTANVHKGIWDCG